MLVHPWDRGTDDDGWEFLRTQGFGQLVAAGRGREVPVIVPTQYAVLPDLTVVLHLARPNPVWTAIEENPAVVLSVAGDWAYVPGGWKYRDDQTPAEGIPTTFYAAAQLVADAEVVADADGLADILRVQTAWTGDTALVDPLHHARAFPGIRGLRLVPRELTTKLKYGGNLPPAVRERVGGLLAERDRPGDTTARRRLAAIPTD